MTQFEIAMANSHWGVHARLNGVAYGWLSRTCPLRNYLKLLWVMRYRPDSW